MHNLGQNVYQTKDSHWKVQDHLWNIVCNSFIKKERWEIFDENAKQLHFIISLSSEWVEKTALPRQRLWLVLTSSAHSHTQSTKK